MFADSALKPTAIPALTGLRSDLKPATIPINNRPVSDHPTHTTNAAACGTRAPRSL